MKEDNISRLSICPRCGKPYYEPPALSRLDNETLICPDCGTREALDSIGVSPEEQDSIIQTIHRCLNEAVKHTISERHVCVVYSSELTCYYSLLERICTHRKGKHHFSGGIQNDESMADSREL